MPWYIELPVALAYLTVIWVTVLALYNLVFEPFDFGPLGIFAGKSAILLVIVALVTIIPYVHWFTFIAWWIGLVVIFKKDIWECWILVFLISGLSLLCGLAIHAVLMSSFRSPISTV